MISHFNIFSLTLLKTRNVKVKGKNKILEIFWRRNIILLQGFDPSKNRNWVDKTLISKLVQTTTHILKEILELHCFLKFVTMIIQLSTEGAPPLVQVLDIRLNFSVGIFSFLEGGVRWTLVLVDFVSQFLSTTMTLGERYYVRAVVFV